MRGLTIRDQAIFGGAAVPPTTGATVLLNFAASLSSSPYTTPSLSPTGSVVMMALGLSRTSAGNPTAPTSIVGCGLTWTLINSAIARSGGTAPFGMWLYKGTGTPTSGTIVITWSYTVASRWATVQIVDLPNATSVVQNATVAGTTASPFSFTLGAFASASNGVFTAITTAGQPAGGQPATCQATGHTELATLNYGTPSSHSAVYIRNDNDTSPTFTNTAGTQPVGGVAAEIG